MSRRLLISAVVLVTLVAGLSGAVAAATLLRPPGSRDASIPASHYIQAGETVTASGVSATLVKAGFTAAETRLELDFESSDGRPLLMVLVPAEAVESQGIERRSPTVSDRGSEGKVRVTLVVGPAVSEDVTISIQKLVLRFMDGEIQTVTGPWSFSVKSGSAGSDPVDVTIAENVILRTPNVEVSVSEVKLTGSGLSASFSVDMSEGDFIGFEGYPARLINADGSWVGARTIGGVGEDGAVTAVFGSVAPGQDAAIEFGPFLRRIEGPFKATIELPGSRTLGAPIELGQTVDIGGHKVIVKSLAVNDESFSLTFTNMPGSRLTVDRDARLTLEDDRGNRYEVTDLVTHASEDASGATTPEYATIIVKGKLPPDARAITAEFSSVAVSEPGPRLSLDIP